MVEKKMSCFSNTYCTCEFCNIFKKFCNYSCQFIATFEVLKCVKLSFIYILKRIVCKTGIIFGELMSFGGLFGFFYFSGYLQYPMTSQVREEGKLHRSIF